MMKSIIVNAAMYSGLPLGILFSLSILLGLSGNIKYAFISNILLLVILFVTYFISRRFRDNECNGEATYWVILQYIIHSYFFGGLISSLVVYIYFQYINPEGLNTFINLYATADPISSSLKEGQNVTPISVSFITLIMYLLLGSFVGSIMSAFVSNKKN